MTTLDALAEWTAGYERAWRSNDPADVAALFTEDAVYRWHPWETGDDVAVGRDQIVKVWLENPDDPSTWEMEYEPVAVNDELGVVTCVISYRASPAGAARTYYNVWLLRMTDDGRCADFVEYYMKEPDPAA